MTSFPWFGDLGGAEEPPATQQKINLSTKYENFGEISPSQVAVWSAQEAVWQHHWRYFSGEIFRDRVPLDTAENTASVPTLYPVGINLVKMLCVAQSEALWGEWDQQDLVRWQVRHDTTEDVSSRAAIELCHLILQSNDWATKGYELSLDREVYGGCAVKVQPDLGRPGHIKLSRIDLDAFYPIWDPENPDELLEAWIKVVMTREQVKQKYGIDVEEDKSVRLEHWTKQRFQNLLNGKEMGAYSNVNPYGVVPIVYIPRLRTDNWYGDALVPDLTSVQDEVNMRVADLGESLNYSTHPTRFGKNLPRNFNSAEFPLGPGAMWDLGRTVMRDHEPEVGILQVENPIPTGAIEFINFLYDWGRTSAFAPPIAFGEDQGGGQRSGRTLEIRMWPLLRSTRRSRAYMAAGLMRIMNIAAIIIGQKNIPNTGNAIAKILDKTVVPEFWPILPKDQAAIVDAVVKLMSIQPIPVLSPETAHQWLGLGPSEMDRLNKSISKYKDLLKPKQTQNGEEQ